MREWLHNVALIAVTAASLLTGGCSAVRHVPDGNLLLDNVKIDISGDKDISSGDLYNYLRQTPNHRVLGFWKLQLSTYNMSGNDSTKWYNRWARRMGQPPVLYQQELTDASARQLQLAMINRGYLDARVDVDTVMRPDKKRIDVTYHVSTGEPHRISSVAYEIPDSDVAKVIMADSVRFTVKPGDKFDRDNLDAERTLITRRLRDRGYYAFNKDYITFFADTAEMSRDVALTMTVRPPKRPSGADTAADSAAIHTLYRIGRVMFITDIDRNRTDLDTVRYKGVEILYGSDRYITPGTLDEKCFLRTGQLYTSHNVDRTYESLARLGILKSVNIELVPEAAPSDTAGYRLLDVYILLSRNKKQSITLDIEGTNSEGDLGFGVGATYQHRNLARGSQLFTGRLRMNYESLSGSFNGLINNRYTEYAGEVGLTFPRFEFPFAPLSMRQRFNVSSELALSFNYQERPEYTRIISGAAWRYKWVNRTNTRRHEFDIPDISYVYLPASTNGFIDEIAPNNPLLRYSYEDHFIMSMSYRYYHTNKRIAAAIGRKQGIQPLVYTIRASAETAGNVLYLGSKLFADRPADGVYELFNTRFSQYVKGEIDYAITRNFDHRHSVAFHVGGGIGYPYGNSRVMPFEKRFYAGGANGVRGWSVRTLGPGSYNSHNSVSYFINQCGDIRLDMSVEYRAKLFWVLEGGAFIDAGNIWTIHDYENQPGGMFRFDTFWKQIALAYGIGLRMDFNYFLLRLDLGIKAYNPAKGQERWPLIHFDWHDNTAIHFSVGYPF